MSAKNLLLSAVLAGCLPMMGWAQGVGRNVPADKSNMPSQLSAGDQQFVQEAAKGDAAEIELGQLAESKAANPDVKAFGERMVTDHSKNRDEVRMLADKEHVTLPTKLGEKENAQKEKLQALSGSQFDKAYMSYMVSEHKTDVMKFKEAASNAQDPSVKQFAEQSLPVLQSHLREAQQVDVKVKSGNSGMGESATAK